MVREAERMTGGPPLQTTASDAFRTGLLHQEAGELSLAESAYRRAISLDATHAEAHNNLANVLYSSGRTELAIAHYRQAAVLLPSSSVAHNNLGRALAVAGRMSEAENCMRRAIECEPGYAEAHNDLGKLLQQRGAREEAEAAYRHAAALKPTLAHAHFNIANLAFSSGRLSEAEREYELAIALNPLHVESQSNLAFVLNYLPGKSPAEIFRAHRRFALNFCPSSAGRLGHSNIPDPDRRLRIGYVSGDLRDHAVAYFIEPVLASHDRARIQIFCYYSYPEFDAVSLRLRSHVDLWRDVHALDDAELAEIVREDAIDILVDLSGHTVHNRLFAFARKPAPVQATWLGYLNTTGLDAIDYRITDAWATPEGLDEFHSEKLVRLPDGQCCFRPQAGSPDVSPAPCLASGTTTFACFTNLSKIAEPMMSLWGQLIRRVPKSRLLLASAILDKIPEGYEALCARHGIAPERLELVGKKPAMDYLAMHGAADVVLDTSPYSSGTTTCHALWMGVPVVTLAGETASSRTATTLLHAVGLDDLVAHSPEQYLNIAASLAADPRRLAALRSGTRARMQASPLMDEARFTRNLEDAYRQMWRTWCGKQIA